MNGTGVIPLGRHPHADCRPTPPRLSRGDRPSPSRLAQVDAGLFKRLNPSSAMVPERSTLVPEDFRPTELKTALRLLWPDAFPSDTSSKMACRRGEVAIDGDRVRNTAPVVKAGQTVELLVRDGSTIHLQARHYAEGEGEGELTQLEVVFEDDHLACIIKPQGLETQGKGNSTVQGLVAFCLKPCLIPGAMHRPIQVHRLDAATGGLLLIAKSKTALRVLSNDFRDRHVSKRYCAIVKGKLEGSGVIEISLKDKEAVTRFEVVQHTDLRSASQSSEPANASSLGTATSDTNDGVGPSGASSPDNPPDASSTDNPPSANPPGANSPDNPPGDNPPGASSNDNPLACDWLTTVHLWPQTGRTHQLRKHMAYTGHPILGDHKYRGPRALGPEPRVDNQEEGDEYEEEEREEGQGSRPAVPGEEVGREEGQGNRLAMPGQVYGSKRRKVVDTLADGSTSPLCLWAVELKLTHPISQEPLHFVIPDPSIYNHIRRTQTKVHDLELGQ